MRAYLAHLAQANEIQPVFAKDDILGDDDNVLVTRGTPITKDVVKTLSGHSCAYTIEAHIALEEEFDEGVILSLMENFVASDPIVQEISQHHDIDKEISLCVRAFSEFPQLRQKLNVLAIQLPDIFDQALFCGWMTLAVLTTENASEDKLVNGFISALSHDFGLLNVNPAILFKTEPLTPEEWQAMQQHPAFSAKLLKGIRGVDKECVRAVLEHHEMVDGTGYPQGRYEKQLGDLGRLLHILDSVNAIYRKHFKVRNRSFRDMVPIIQMATLSHSGSHGNTLVSILNESSATEHCSLGASLIPNAVELIQINAKEIADFIMLTGKFSQAVGTGHQELHVLTLQNIARMIRSTMFSCGIINEAYLRWIEQVRDENLDFAYRELEDVLLMTQEIKFHMHRYHRQLGIYLNQDNPGNLVSQVTTLNNNLDKIGSNSDIEQELQAYLAGKNEG